ncbi:unnamed protein product [Merluccius merluccius]
MITGPFPRATRRSHAAPHAAPRTPHAAPPCSWCKKTVIPFRHGGGGGGGGGPLGSGVRASRGKFPLS